MNTLENSAGPSVPDLHLETGNAADRKCFNDRRGTLNLLRETTHSVADANKVNGLEQWEYSRTCCMKSILDIIDPTSAFSHISAEWSLVGPKMPTCRERTVANERRSKLKLMGRQGF